jgi:hypothetical protein
VWLSSGIRPCWQRQAAAGHPVDVWVTDEVLQFYDGDQLLRTEKRTTPGEVRVKRSPAPQRRSRVKTSVTDRPKALIPTGPQDTCIGRTSSRPEARSPQASSVSAAMLVAEMLPAGCAPRRPPPSTSGGTSAAVISCSCPGMSVPATGKPGTGIVRSSPLRTLDRWRRGRPCQSRVRIPG